MLAERPPHAGIRWTEIRATRGVWPPLRPDELWAYRDVGLILMLRDVRLRYKQTFFGVAWAVMQPLIAMGLFTVVLGGFAGFSTPGVPYPAFVLAGLAVWFPFSTALGSAAESLVENPELVTKVWFPRILAPLAAILAGGVDLAVTVGIALVAAVILGIEPQLPLLLLPLASIALLLVTLGFGLWLSALNVLYRDVRYALGFVMQLLFFATPVVYPSSIIDGPWAFLLALNPLTGTVDVFRWALLDAPPSPGLSTISLASGIVVLVGGLLFFRWAERAFADRI
jgi:lipopolysaccharide transport system permease protein